MNRVRRPASARLLLASLLVTQLAAGAAQAQRAVAPATAPAAPPPVPIRCVDDSAPEPLTAEPDDGALATPDPRVTLQTLVREAQSRSHQVGAAQLLAEAADDEAEAARAARGVRADLTMSLGPGGSEAHSELSSNRQHAAAQWRGTLGASQLLWDGGRTDSLVTWRTQLAESARQGHLSTREQLALTTVALALDRARLRQHVVIYGRYLRKMACLGDALELIVRADRGRASELVQARKSMQQAELAQAQAQSQLRQIEIRLRRLVGDGLPPTQGLASLLLETGDLNQRVADVENSSELASLAAQQAAAAALAESIAASGKPSLSWSASGTSSVSRGGSVGSLRENSWQLGVQISVPLLNPGQRSSTDAARRRARAAELQRAEVLEQRRFRVAELHELAQASSDRARRLGGVLRDSDQVRNATLQQWQQLGRRSLFDVMGAEAEHYNLRVAYVNALHEVQQLNANMLSLGRGVQEWLR
jgi:outer membrane protein, adhesin transport system